MGDSPSFSILLVAATPFELEPTVNWLRARAVAETGNILHFKSWQCEVLFTGVGAVATAFTLGKHFVQTGKPSLAIQAGLGGAYHRDLELTQVVQITSECMGDLGAESADGSVLSLGDIGFHPGPLYTPSETLELLPYAHSTPFPPAIGVTVAQTTGTLERRAKILARWPAAQVETMEGAVFFQACLDAGVNPVQLRSISNYVEQRNRERWKVQEAIESLNVGLQRLLCGFL